MEGLFLGGMYRIIGAVLIISGLYFVLWGKSEEKKFAAKEKAAIPSTAEHGNVRTSSHIKSSLTQPLLPPSTESVWPANPNPFDYSALVGQHPTTLFISEKLVCTKSFCFSSSSSFFSALLFLFFLFPREFEGIEYDGDSYLLICAPWALEIPYALCVNQCLIF